MKIHDINEVSKMLAEFDFAGIKGIVTIESSVVYYDYVLDDDGDLDTKCSWDFDEFSVELYGSYKPTSGPEAWDAKDWAEYIEEELQRIQTSNAMSDRHYDDNYHIDTVTIEYASAREGDEEEPLCDLRSSKFYKNDERKFNSIYIHGSTRRDVMPGTLRDVDVKSVDELMEIVCTKGLTKDDFPKVY